MGSFPPVLELEHALAGAGRCLLTLGHTGEAVEPLRDARERSSSLGAVPLVAEIDGLPSSRPRSPWSRPDTLGS